MATNFPQYQQAIGANALQPNSPDLDAMAQLQAQYDALQQQINARGHRQVDPAQLRQAQDQNSLDQQFGMLMQLTGDEGAGNIGASVLKQAMAKRTPTVTERGSYDPMTQQWDYNPEYLNERDMSKQEALQGRIASVQEQRSRDASERQWREEQKKLDRDAAAERTRMMATAQGAKLPNDMNRAAMGFDSMDSILDQIENELKDFDPRNPNDQMNAAKRARVDSLASQYRLEAKEAAALGALTGPDLSLVDEMLAPLTSGKAVLLGREGLKAQINATRGWSAAKRVAASRRFPGVDFSKKVAPAPEVVSNDMSDLTPTVALPQAMAASGARR
jgi:hypothetical protein